MVLRPHSILTEELVDREVVFVDVGRMDGRLKGDMFTSNQHQH